MSWNREKEYPRAKCDAKGCDEIAPEPGVYTKETGKPFPGWQRLGWHCSGGTHYCPKHNPEKDKA